jgi:hypothetical protein
MQHATGGAVEASKNNTMTKVDATHYRRVRVRAWLVAAGKEELNEC